MARPSKLTDRQWEEFHRRKLNGEKQSDLCKEYGVSNSTASERFSKSTETVKDAANQIVSAHRNLMSLPESEKVVAFGLAQALMTVSENMAFAAVSGSFTSRKLNEIAAKQIERIDPNNPLEPDSQSERAIKAIAVLTKTGNVAAEVGLTLLTANKEKNEKKSGPTLEDLVTGAGK